MLVFIKLESELQLFQCADQDNVLLSFIFTFLCNSGVRLVAHLYNGDGFSLGQASSCLVEFVHVLWCYTFHDHNVGFSDGLQLF